MGTCVPRVSHVMGPYESLATRPGVSPRRQLMVEGTSGDTCNWPPPLKLEKQPTARCSMPLPALCYLLDAIWCYLRPPSVMVFFVVVSAGVQEEKYHNSERRRQLQQWVRKNQNRCILIPDPPRPPSAPDDLEKIREHPVEAMFDSRSIFHNVIEELEASQAFLKSQKASS